MSWNTAPPYGQPGIVAGQGVDADAALEVSLGQMLSDTTTPGCWPSASVACSTTSPRSLPRRTLLAVGDAQRARVVGVDHHRRPALALAGRIGVSVKLVLRKLRAGAVDQAERLVRRGLLDHRHVVRQSSACIA